MMLRRDVVQSVLDLFEQPRYLEVGVNTGETFLPLRASEKVAVDPNFSFDCAADKSGAVYHEITSDAFFGGPGVGKMFDVIYLDGLHTFEQTLRDFCNSVSALATNGVIVIDDVIPNSYYASLPDQPLSRRVASAVRAKDNAWMGDVYRLVWFIDTFFQQFSFATTPEGHGQLIAWRQPRSEDKVTQRSAEAIARLPYEETLLSRDTYCRLPMEKILGRIKSARSISLVRA